MQSRRVCLIINPHAGKNFEELSGILAVFAAAGWKTDIALKEFGGHAMELARSAAEQGYDMIVAYGGDGTLNQVVNGVMNARTRQGRRNVVGIIPGGTANQWATELGIPADPVKAALLLVNSRVRSIDIGHLDVRALEYPGDASIQEAGKAQENHGERNGATPRRKKLMTRPGAKHHFLLTAGLGIDAAVIGGVSKTLKYRVGRLAFGVAAAKKLPNEHAFPLRIAVKEKDEAPEWEGQSVQVLLGNTRRYADVVELTPNAYIDDGVLDVCVITSGTPLTTVQQITSLLVRRKPADVTTEYFHCAHLTMTLPASVSVQLDGTAIPLKRLLKKSDLRALQDLDDPEQALLTYRFDALPRTLRVAIPRDYDGVLFARTGGRGPSHIPPEQAEEQKGSQTDSTSASEAEQKKDGLEDETSQTVKTLQTQELHPGERKEKGQQEQPEQATTRSGDGRLISVISAVQVPGRKQCAIIAGITRSKGTGALKLVAVKVTHNRAISKADGQAGTFELIHELQEGQEIVVEGKQSKRGVISARRVII